jgi:two-component system cell cycle sensor histidine kinase/response regulator CckA
VTPHTLLHNRNLTRRLAEAEATIEALLSGQVDAVVDSRSMTPVLLSKAQDALRASEERYRRIVETATEGIWAVDENSATTFVNGQMARMVGYSAEEMIGMPMGKFVGNAHRGSAAQAVEQGRQGVAVVEDSTIRRKDGSEIWVRVSAAPIHDSDGKYVGGLAMITDRTPHRAAEEALRQSEEQYRQIVETTSDGIIQLDRADVIVFANHPAAEMLGYQPSEMVGKPFSLVTVADKTEASQTPRQTRLGANASWDGSLRRRDGAEVVVSMTSTPIVGGDAERVGRIAVIRDVTERRKLQSQLMVSDRMASVGTMAAGVAHEINNPLAAVLANLDYIAESLVRLTGSERGPMSYAARDAWIREEVKPSLDDAREAAERVRFIVRDLKMFSRSPSEERTGPVNVKAIMESSLRMAWNEVRHRARLAKNYGVIPDVDANEARLGQVFLNLIVNAAQAMPEGRAEENEIRVSTRLEGDQVIVEVRDTGAGIPAENLTRIFDAFFTTKGVGEGSGLGLAICYRIVKDIGGDLTVESEVGVGTVFRVSLPVAKAEAIETVALPPTTPAARRGRILLVDDEEMVIRALTRILSRGNDVVSTLAAKDALARCERGEEFDLILCDLMMPIMTGMELYHELVRVAPEQAKRMIFVTGGAFTEKARTFLSETLKEHIEKPFNAANLRAIVNRYLNS